MEDVTNLLLDPVMAQQGGRALMQMMQMERASRMAMQGGGMTQGGQNLRAPAAPRAGGRAGRPVSMGGGAPASSSDMSGSPQLESLLAQYGLHPAQQQPNVLLPNQGFFGDHPNLSRGIENAVIAAAHTPESTTTGGGISAVAQGVLGIPQYRNQVQMQRQAAPLAMAGAMQNLQKGQLDNDLLKAHAKYYGAEADAIPGKMAMQAEIGRAKQELQQQGLDLKRHMEDRLTGQNNIINDLKQQTLEMNSKYKDSVAENQRLRTETTPMMSALAQAGYDPASGQAPTAAHYRKAGQIQQSNAMALASARASVGDASKNNRLATTTKLGVMKKSITDKQNELKKADSDPMAMTRWYIANRASVPIGKGEQPVQSISDPRVKRAFDGYKQGLQQSIGDLTNKAISVIPGQAPEEE